MISLSQRDARWSEKKIGASSLTIGRWGCTTCAISMLTDFFGKFQDPGQIAAHKEFYTADGLVLWTKLSLADMNFQWRQQGRDDKKILASLGSPKEGVILQVSNGSHWVVAVKKVWWKNDYVCIDPWTGKTCNAVAAYGNITGSAHFTKA